MAAHRKSDQRRVCPWAVGLGKILLLFNISPGSALLTFFVDRNYASSASIAISSESIGESLQRESEEPMAAGYVWRSMSTETAKPLVPQAIAAEAERLAYSIQESADLLGVDYFSVYRLIQRGKLRACRALRGKLLVPRSELLRLLNN